MSVSSPAASASSIWVFLFTPFSGSDIDTPFFSSSARSLGVTTFSGIVMSVPESISEILSAISDSGTTRTTLLYLERITFRGLPSLASLPLTLPLFHSTSPTESFAYCALYPLVSSLSGTSTSTVTRLGRIHADLNWSLRGEREVCQYGLYAAFTSVAFFPVASLPPLSSLNTYLGVPSLYVPS